MDHYQIEFEPVGRRGACRADESLLEAARQLGVDLISLFGMFPTLPPERFKQVGNAAGMGARLALLSTKVRSEARGLCSRINYVELARYPDFSRIFARSCQLKPYARLL